jgi:hypothetical protein
MSAVRLGVRVHHARGNRRIVLLERPLEVLDRLMGGRLGREDLGAAAPDHHHPIEAVVGLELPHVGDDLLGEIFLVLPLLDVRTLQPFHVPLIEHGGPGTDLLELGPHFVEQRRLDDAGGPRRCVAVVLENIPAAEDNVVESGKRHNLADLRRPPLRAFTKTDGAHLRERADRFGQALPNGEDAGDRGGAHGAETDEQHAELAACGSDVNRCRHGDELYQPPATSHQSPPE